MVKFYLNITVRDKPSRIYQPWQFSTVQKLLGKNSAIGSGSAFSKSKDSSLKLPSLQLYGEIKKSHQRSNVSDADIKSSGSGKISIIKDASSSSSSSLNNLLTTGSLSRSSLFMGSHISGVRPTLQSQKFSSSDWKKPGAYRCTSCGKLYRWKKNLISHRRLECGKEPQLQCPYCPHRTKHKSSLVKHVDRLHGQPCTQETQTQ